MKTYAYLKEILMVIGLALLLTIFITKPIHAQDTVKKGQTTTVKMKIIKNENGKETVFDTSFTTNSSMNREELKEMMSGMEDDMKGMKDDMKEFTINLNEMELPDSGMMDSIRKITDRVIVMSRNFKAPHARGHNNPHAYNYDFDYDFDLPVPPEPPIPPSIPGEFHKYMNRNWNWNSKGQTLSDVIGDIPMDRVKNYSIKDRKNGKRIVIDVEDSPLLAPVQERVVVIRDHDRNNAPGAERKKVEKIIIDTDQPKPDK
jgi:hypothetical protein